MLSRSTRNYRIFFAFLSTIRHIISYRHTRTNNPNTADSIHPLSPFVYLFFPGRSFPRPLLLLLLLLSSSQYPRRPNLLSLLRRIPVSCSPSALELHSRPDDKRFRYALFYFPVGRPTLRDHKTRSRNTLVHLFLPLILHVGLNPLKVTLLLRHTAILLFSHCRARGLYYICIYIFFFYYK